MTHLKMICMSSEYLLQVNSISASLNFVILAQPILSTKCYGASTLTHHNLIIYLLQLC